jgi:uncharacterized protein YqeY
MLRSQIDNARIAKGETLSEEEAIEVLVRDAKRRKESIEAFKEGEREDLVDQETRALEITSSYLPEALSEDELKAIVHEVIAETEAESMKDMGKVMGALMPRVKGRAEGKRVQEMVKTSLS